MDKELIRDLVHNVLEYCAETCGTEVTVDYDEYGVRINIKNAEKESKALDEDEEL